jgi:hypothetical protein
MRPPGGPWAPRPTAAPGRDATAPPPTCAPHRWARFTVDDRPRPAAQRGTATDRSTRSAQPARTSAAAAPNWRSFTIRLQSAFLTGIAWAAPSANEGLRRGRPRRMDDRPGQQLIADRDQRRAAGGWRAADRDPRQRRHAAASTASVRCGLLDMTSGAFCDRRCAQLA